MDLQLLADQAREKRQAKMAEAEAIIVAAATGGENGGSRPLTEDESRKYDSLMDEAAAALKEQTRCEKLITEKASLAQSVGRRSAPSAAVGSIVETPKPVEIRTLRRAKALRSFRGADADRNAYTSGQWLLATLGGDTRAAQWCADNGIETRALQTTTNSLGGYSVPEVLESTIIDLREERGVARRSLRVMPMSTDSHIIPRRATGLTAYFVAENSEITASDKGWDAVQLVARKLAVLCKYSSELNEDSILSIADDLAGEIAYSFADKEDECCFNGDGTSTYGGIVGLKSAILAGSKVTAATGNTSFGTLDMEDFLNMVGKLPFYARTGARWYVSQAGFAASMERLFQAAGGNTVQNLSAGVPYNFLGFPVEITQVMNQTLSAQTSTDGLVYFGNLNLAGTMGTRRGISIQVDGSRYFEYDQLAIRGTERFDINIHEKGTASVAGPVIMLSTPAS